MRKIFKNMLVGASLVIGALNYVQAAQVTPSKINVPNGVKMFTVSLLNNEKEEKTYEIKILDWSVDGLKDSTSVTSSRPVIIIPPNQTAKIRFMFTERKQVPMEFYQVVLKDITPRKPDEKGARAVIEMHVPVFAVGELDKLKPQLELNDGVLKNTGNTHVQITGIKGAKVVNYLLPGQTYKVPGITDIKDITYNYDMQ